jgi:hypothetical protein
LRLFTDLGHELQRIFRGATDEHYKFRRRIATLIAVTAVIDAIGTTLMYVLEHGEGRSGLHSVFESFFWVTTQLLTVSSQLPNPVTTGGRVVDMLLQIWAITVVATVAASFAAFLQKK